MVARRVKELRGNMSAARLAEEMTKLGVPWKREVVANLESGRRNRLDVDELLALAMVLQVPPIALLVDPTAELTPITPTHQAHTAHTLLWLAGEKPFDVNAASWWQEQAPIRLVRQLEELVRQCHAERQAADSTDSLVLDVRL